MKSLLIYIFFLLLIPLVGRAETDTISNAFLQKISINLANVIDGPNADDLKNDPFASKKIIFPDFDEAYAKFGIGIFKTKLEQSTYFYSSLKDLKPNEKQQLVSEFSSYDVFFSFAFEEANLPVDLKYLAPAISAMNPKAVGNGKRAGVWQLSHFQAVLNGLQVDRLVDERFDVALSTKAFVDQVQQNIKLFGSVENAVVAYFTGNVKMKNILEQLGEDVSLELILNVLPDYISERISAFQAMAVFLKTNTFNPELQQQKDTVFVNRRLHFKQVSQVLHIPVQQLKALNPQYPYFIVPGDKKEAKLFLPDGKRDDFILWRDSVFNAGDSTLFELVTQKIEYPPAPTRQYNGEKVKDLEIEGKTKIKYVIQTGEVLGFIAEDYDVQVEDLKYWNNIYNERKIQAGATLDIFVDDDKADYFRNLQKQVAVSSSAGGKTTQQKVFEVPGNARKIEHIVKNGESPYVIAKKYDGVSPEAILYWNGISDARKIQIGQKLILYLTQ